MKFETKAIHAGQEPDKTTGAVIVPVYQTSTYHQEDIGIHKGFEYSRTGNPTRQALETALASVENGKFGLAFSSGLAASVSVLNLLKPGDHIISCDDIYGGTYRLFENVFKEWNLKISYLPIEEFNDLEKHIQPNTKMVWIETPTNPLLRIIDIKSVAQITSVRNVILVVDNTFATPYFQTPLDLGADIIVHSTTKYISGHSDIIGGAVITSNDTYYEKIKYYQNAAGSVPGIWDSWLVLRGLKTLAVRMKQHDFNANKIAQYLVQHPKIELVSYPGLPSHPDFEIANSQMSGFSGIVSIKIKGGIKEVKLFISKLKIFLLAESLGGVESLICYPSEMTHGAIPQSEREKRGITENLVRLSVGIENIDDLLIDIEQALS